MKSTLLIPISCLLLACNLYGQKAGNVPNETTNNSNQKKMKSLKIERQFNTTPERVFEVFTKPEEMIVWWTEDTRFDIDLKVGGKYTITREENGMNLRMTGEY